jgi:phage terminase small subunit
MFRGGPNLARSDSLRESSTKRRFFSTTCVPEAYAKGKTLKQAAIEAGYSKKNADQSGYQVLKAIKGSMVNENKKRLVE